jgi:hypothetical protein
MCSLTLSACAGAPRQLEPRTPPPRIEPAIQLPTAPIQPGTARVVLTTTDTPMKITAQADASFVPPGATVAPTRSGELCTTPCVVDLPLGRYKLFMNAARPGTDNGDVDELLVNPGVNYYVRAPGKYEAPEWIPVVPTLLVVAGAVLLTGGAILAGAGDDTGSHVGGGTLMAGGLSLGIVGGVMSYNKSRATMQQGATTTWTVPAP